MDRTIAEQRLQQGLLPSNPRHVRYLESRSSCPVRGACLGASQRLRSNGRSIRGPCRHLCSCSIETAPGQEVATPGAAEEVLTRSGEVVQLFRRPGLSQSATKTLLRKVHQKVTTDIEQIETELCFNVALERPLSEEQAATLTWLLRETYEPEQLTPASTLEAEPQGNAVVEVGPRLSFQSAWSTNAVSICRSCGLDVIPRLEISRRFLLRSSKQLPADTVAKFAAMVHDRMTEQVYLEPLQSFTSPVTPSPVFTVPVLEQGRRALEDINEELGLAFDEQDIVFYTRMFQEEMKRDPTNVELFDMAQSNSEHSRHWFFGAQLILDGKPAPETLMQIVKATLKANPRNSVIGFKDNSSAIRGTNVEPVLPLNCGSPSALAPQPRDWDLLLTAETHNFPCAVAPYPGAETGAGGRMRDTHATGIGSIMGAGTAGYCVGNLQLDGMPLPGEDASFPYPESLASPLQILIDASNGASDYGNKFGEPLIAGYTRTFGLRMPSGERREWIKPIMFSGGLGQIDHSHLHKKDPDIGMLIVKIGGPAYRIGMGGGAASSVPSGSSRGDLDFNAVQRGDAEMAQKLWRVVRACVELGPRNPIQQIHDQGAGGNCNVVKEIIYPLGATIDIRQVALGDQTMSVLEIWGAEYQENDCLLIKPDDRPLLEAIAARERCIMQVIGSISGSGRITLVDNKAQAGEPTPVDLDLEKVLGDMPQKTFEFTRRTEATAALDLSQAGSPQEALDKVLRLPAVCSKRFLTTKVDRCVTGLVAQQQCCGPLQLPVADVAVMAQTHTGLTGAATSIGEQPLKGLVNPAAMARIALGEALTNLMFAAGTDIADIKASVNWMYAAKMEHEGAAMYDAAVALRGAMIELGLACDGGKDSLSMAASAGGEVVKAPGNLVISAYVTCPDITLTVTPDLKLPGSGKLLWVDLGQGRRRLGGSALAHAYSQVGDEVPDVASSALKGAWEATQQLLRQRKISAGHDISDGGIVTALLEMSFSGNTGISVDIPGDSSSAHGAFPALFAEELGLVLEVDPESEAEVRSAYEAQGLSAVAIGSTSADKAVSISVGGEPTIQGEVGQLRDVWEATAFRLEREQSAEETVEQEQRGLAGREAPLWHLPYTPTWTPDEALSASDKPRVAILREEGSNGDREMSAAVYAAGLEPWDITMSDLLMGRATLDSFTGIVFVGGFSYADVLDSAKGWAGTIRRNAQLWQQFQAFYSRTDTFSLGVCNGCQLMALLGWIPGGALQDVEQPRFVHNTSGRFECRWATVEIRPSPSVLLKGMDGAKIGIWCAHGEGRAKFPSSQVYEDVLAQDLAPVRYTDALGEATEAYPFNPNGSPDGIAALTSANGRHLAIMPHPERCFMTWQNPWYPKDIGLTPDGPSPWLKLFQNAREWCCSVSK
ncbi:g3007 [Coccomyxa viridis]|uniref:phosphoribosylformylglycinamidine synthase n=1 Tax=Coccomyxa viridis TaxID=1274662 RepID=A0ABP1FS62_9CHLO